VTGTFDPGYIISDAVFFNGSAMTGDEVQAFLESQVPTCDTYHAASGYSPPFTCLKDFRVINAVEPADAYCAEVPAGNHRASDIIALVGQACGVSQKVLLVLLQKEQSLVTDTWPWPSQYRSATGYGCPDTAACDARYYGLFNQLVMAAWQFKYYVGNPNSYNYKAGQTNDILYNPDASCGTASVYIRNAATAALYIYTPYTPNAAALGNPYGVGDSCSSYGNRNFWRIFNDWFGNPTEIKPTGITVSRIGGAGRYEVGVGVSAGFFSPGVPVVYIASGEVFPDAISAGPAAALGRGPVLLVPKDNIPDVVAAELDRLHPAHIVVVGGPGSVSNHVLAELGQYAPLVDRISGLDRYEVSRSLALKAFSGGSTIAYLATGSVFADALSSGAAAGSRHAPVILIDGSLSALDAATSAALDALGVTRVYVSGGPGSVSDGILNSLSTRYGSTNVTRFGGQNRFNVSSAVNKNAFTKATTFYVASGLVFPDALSAAPVAIATGSPLYVTDTNCLDRDMVQHMIDAGATKMVIVGGPASVSTSVESFRNC
jgi:putative cell wall-binding protein